MVSPLVKPIILAQFVASFLPSLQYLGSYLILGFTLIVSSWVGAVIDAMTFYGHVRTCTSAMHFGKGKETKQATIFKSAICVSVGSLNGIIIYSPKC